LASLIFISFIGEVGLLWMRNFVEIVGGGEI